MNSNDEKGVECNQGHGRLNHMLHMIICCGLPIILILSLPAISAFSPNTGRVISKVIPFLCPIMMIFMMPRMMGNNRENCDHTTKQESKLKELS